MSVGMEHDFTDSALVAAHLGGDRAALAGIYDRYAASLYDTAAAMLRNSDEAADAVQEVFVVAARKLGGLRQPERLRAWLFAVLRNEVYLRSKQRRRNRPIDLTTSGAAEMAAPPDPGADAAGVEYLELASLVRAAAAGLDRRDQLVMELSIRQNLSGADLADAVGVSESQAYVLVHRMRDRFSRSLGALVVARSGRRECPELDALLRGWDGRFSVLVRKRVARHIERCDTCERTHRRAGVAALLGAAPAFALPASLRQRVLEEATSGTASGQHRFGDDGFPRAPRPARRSLAMAAAAAVIAAVVGVGAAVAGGGGSGRGGAGGDSPGPQTLAPGGSTGANMTTGTPATTGEPPSVTVATTSPPTTGTTTTVPGSSTTTAVPAGPGVLALSATILDLGANVTSATLTLTNTGGSPLQWSIADDGGAGPFSWSSLAGSLSPRTSLDLSVAVDRSTVPEGTVSRRFTARGGSAAGQPVEVRAAVERLPVVTIVRAVTTLRCPWSASPTVAALVEDESAVGEATLSWQGPAAPGRAPMTSTGPGQWRGTLGVPRVNGTWTWTVTAVDVRGNPGSSSGSVEVSGCG